MRVLLVEDDTVLGAAVRDQIAADGHSVDWVMRLDRDDRVIRRVDAAARAIGLELAFERAGCGSDANIYNGHGLATAIIATGMTNVHSTSEQVTLQDMVDLTRLLVALLTEPSC